VKKYTHYFFKNGSMQAKSFIQLLLLFQTKPKHLRRLTKISRHVSLYTIELGLIRQEQEAQ